MGAPNGPRNLEEFMRSAWTESRDLEGLSSVITAIANGAKKVQEQVQRAAIGGALGTTGETNVHGEMVQHLDSAGSDIFVEILRESDSIAAIGSEEIEGIEVVGSEKTKRYVVQMDPVDGSSNIDVAVTIGSIFGIWQRDPGEEAVTESLLLKPGREQVAAAYVVYGSSTILVTATPSDVNGFTLDSITGEFLLTHPSIVIPDKCEYYSVNEGNFKKLDSATQKAISRLRENHSLRYVGSLVADFHRNLLTGGIFLYPGDASSPEGKLRLMYEANPLGYIAEQAGGAAFSSEERILDIQPIARHQRIPLILGNKQQVEETISTIKRN